MEKAQDTDNTKAKWTIMAYMAGDNNLDGAAIRDIDEMARVGSTRDVSCLVQLDRIEDKLTRRFRITPEIQCASGFSPDWRWLGALSLFVTDKFPKFLTF
jgi:hypothetical protein